MTNALTSSVARLGQKLDTFKKGAALVMAELDALQPYAKQSRTTFDPEYMKELAASIKELGILEPILARSLGNGRYEILAGERRWRAARMAGLTEVPILSKTVDEETADKIHLAENIHRENLSTLDLAQRVAQDIEEAKGNLNTVVLKYGKTKSWVSKLSTIAKGGEVMADVVESGASSDRAVLATVSALERKSPEAAKELGKRLKQADSAANKRSIAEQFAKASKAAMAGKASKPDRFPRETQTQDGEEPDWRQRNTKSRTPSSMLVMLELSPHSRYATEFAQMSKKYGAARLAIDARHPSAQYVLVEFGDTGLQRRMYAAQELRLLSVA